MEPYRSFYCYSTLTFTLFHKENPYFLKSLSPLFCQYLWGDLCVWWSVRAMQETYFTEFLPHLSENRAFITTLASVKFLSQNNALCWCDTLITNLVLLHWQRIKKIKLISAILQALQNKICLRGNLKTILLYLSKSDSTLK